MLLMERLTLQGISSAPAMINAIYRISDGSYTKAKLPGVTKEVCLRNFLDSFVVGSITIMADNCGEDTLTMCRRTEKKMMETSLGNAGSIRGAIEMVLDWDDNAIVYFVEDDYLHLRMENVPFESIPERDIAEGLLKADYVTLYDHPDKYLREYQRGEQSQVVRTQHAHWRYSVSTTMTFASTAKVLREDIEIWRKHTEGGHPDDHKIFTELGKKGRKLVVRIPGTACHTDLTYSNQKKTVFMDQWAFQTMEQILGIPEEIEAILPESGLQRLMMLASLAQ